MGEISMSLSRIGIILTLCMGISLLGANSLGPTIIPDAGVSATLSYTHPQTGKAITFQTNSRKTNTAEGPSSEKEWAVPANVKLTVTIEVENLGDVPLSDGISLDVWYDYDGEGYPADESDCDWICVPEDPDDCRVLKRTLTVDPDFPGKAGKGVYSLAAWVDRFDTITEFDEKNNFVGIIKIKPILTATVKPKILQPKAIQPVKRLAIAKNTDPIKIFPFKLEKAQNAQRFSFQSDHPAGIRIRIEWRGKPERLQAILRNESTDQILKRTSGASPFEFIYTSMNRKRTEKMSIEVRSRYSGTTSGRIAVISR